MFQLLTGEKYKSAQSQRKSKCKVLGQNKTRMEVLSVDPIRGVDSWPQFSRWVRLQRNISAHFPFIHKSRFLDAPLLNQGLLTYISKNMFSLRPPPAAGPLWHHNHLTQGNKFEYLKPIIWVQILKKRNRVAAQLICLFLSWKLQSSLYRLLTRPCTKFHLGQSGKSCHI